ncbi:unnamed protein product [Clonostachys rhizophaga]|uniref:DUF6536 domain-containing protein n=1 Tax=Clonostachys rhizophaga TaxID=160324 RepID=A0A9N9VM70_9HYPO|nr:unnamed protein product [Clonostachys rhizophaga]
MYHHGRAPLTSSSPDPLDRQDEMRGNSYEDAPGEVSISPLSPLVRHVESQLEFSERSSSACSTRETPCHPGSDCQNGVQSKIEPRWRMPTGWKLGTMMAATLTFVILLVNTILAALFTSSVLRTKYSSSSIAPVRTGDCGAIKSLATGTHVLINIVSTLLLGASNYCMQTVSAPMRQDVDNAHARGKWLDIGIPSVRNLLYIEKRRLVVWLCLGLSSIPLHFIYNSTFIVSTANQLYQILLVNESFISGGPFDIDSKERHPLFDIDGHEYYIPFELEVGQSLQFIQEAVQKNEYEKLTPDDCIKAYAKGVVYDRANVVVVLSPPEDCHELKNLPMLSEANGPVYCEPPMNSSIYASLRYETILNANRGNNDWFSWICSLMSYEADHLRLPKCRDGAWKNQMSPAIWTIGTARVKYCLSQKPKTPCQLNVALNLIYVVVCFNALKFVIIVILATSNLVNREPLVTIGDAVASFIDSQEPATKGMCLLSSAEAHFSQELDDYQEVSAVVYKPQNNRCSVAASLRRWLLASILIIVALATLVGLLGHGVHDLNQRFSRGDWQSLWDLGIGTINPYTTIEWKLPRRGEASVIATVLISNLPQVLLSFLYLILNGLITSMAGAIEWSKYGQGTQRPLRVSFPKGKQRSTFFLQLPYRYSIPMLSLSVLMHWMVSQSLFVVQIFEESTWESIYEDADYLGVDSAITIPAYSPMAIILTIVIVAVTFLGIVGLGRVRLRDGLPTTKNSSLVISAACHPLEGTSSMEAVKWGVVLIAEDGSNQVGHCSFSNHKVGFPEEGRAYS